MSYSVILRQGGVDRTYQCENHWDYIVLYDALCDRYGSVVVEGWQGNIRIN